MRGMEGTEANTGRWKWWALLAVLIVALILVGLAYWLYQLGGADQSPLERVRDIAVIFLSFQLMLATLSLIGIAAGLVFLIMVLKDQVIPLLTDPPRLSRMSVAAAGAGHRDAADAVARIVVEVAGR